MNQIYEAIASMLDFRIIHYSGPFQQGALHCALLLGGQPNANPE